MSLLTKPRQQSPVPEFRAKADVMRLKLAPRRMVDFLYRNWKESFDLLWTTKDGVTPAMRVAELGTDAGELFQMNGILVQFLLDNLVGKDDELAREIQAKVATMPDFSINRDGTVTLLS